MSQLKNYVQLLGNVGQEPEFKTFEKGNLIKFSLATNDYYNDKNGETVQDTQWHNIVAWSKTADRMKSILKKGSEVLVKGKLSYTKYDDKNGVTRYQSQITVNDFIKLDRKEALVDTKN